MKTFKDLIESIPTDIIHDPEFKAMDRALSMDNGNQLKSEWREGNLTRIINLLHERLHNKKDIKLAYEYIKKYGNNNITA